jgi:hypothetical protein
MMLPTAGEVSLVGELRDRLEAVAVDARSPDRQISASTHGKALSVDVVFRPGCYRRYREVDLAHQLAEVMTRLFEQYRQARRDAVDAVVEMAIHGDNFDADPKDRRYFQRAQQIEATGESDDG